MALLSGLFQKGVRALINRKRMQKLILDGLFYAAGSLLYAAAVNVFVDPANLVPGGLTGVGLVFQHLFGLPVGMVMIALNIPLFLVGWRLLGRSFFWRTAVCTLLTSVFIDLTAPFLPAYEGDRMLAALFGGLFSGVGLGLIYLRDATSGGTEIIARLLEIRFPSIPIGRLLLIVDAVVILGGAFVHKDADGMMYAAILVAVTTVLIDRMLAGMDAGKLLMIQTSRPQEVTDAIFRHLDRGVTRLKATGGYSGEERPMLMCAVRKAEFHELQQIVAHCDPGAFVIVMPADWVYGEGFRLLSAHKKKKELTALAAKPDAPTENDEAR